MFTFLKLFITEIPEIKNYKIINAAVKTLKDNLVAFDANLLIKSEEFFNKLLVLIRHDNRDVKENASDLFEKYLERLAEKLDEDEIRHKVNIKHNLENIQPNYGQLFRYYSWLILRSFCTNSGNKDSWYICKGYSKNPKRRISHSFF